MTRQLGTLGAADARAGVLGARGTRGRQALGRWAQRGSGRSGARGSRRGRRAGSAWAGHWAGGLGAWAGQGCALGALGLFSTRFDSVFFLSRIFGHCS